MRTSIRRYLTSVTATLGLIAASTSTALAADPFNGGIAPTGGIKAKPGQVDLVKTVKKVGNQIINIVSIILAVVATLYLIYNGYKYITAGGDTKKTADARAGIINAVIGIIIIALAYTIINFALGASGTIGSLFS